MKSTRIFAMYLVAISSVSTGAIGQNAVYRCGSSYSQSPCPDAAVVNVQDARSQAQKMQADAAIRRDTVTGNAVQNARLAQEAQQHAAQRKLATLQSKSSAHNPTSNVSPSDTTEAKVSKRKNAAKLHKHTPEHFVAIAPGSGKKPSRQTGKGQ